MLEMIPVVSSTIKAIGYREETESIKARLTVIFNSGGRYNYDGVPQDLWERLKDAESVGRFFAREIKSRFEGVKQ